MQTYTKPEGGTPKTGYGHSVIKKKRYNDKYVESYKSNMGKPRKSEFPQTHIWQTPDDTEKEIQNKVVREADKGTREIDPTQGWGSKLNAEILYNRLPSKKTEFKGDLSAKEKMDIMETVNRKEDEASSPAGKAGTKLNNAVLYNKFEQPVQKPKQQEKQYLKVKQYFKRASERRSKRYKEALKK